MVMKTEERTRKRFLKNVILKNISMVMELYWSSDMATEQSGPESKGGSW